MTLMFIIMSPEVSCRPMLGPVRAWGWRGSKPLCGLLDIGVPLEVSQKVGKRAKKRNEGEGKRKHSPAFLSGLCTDERTRFYSDSDWILYTSLLCFVIFQGRTRKDWCKLSMKNGRASITCGLANHWYLMRTLGNCSETRAKDGY